jgi:hypothetical protein
MEGLGWLAPPDRRDGVRLFRKCRQPTGSHWRRGRPAGRTRRRCRDVRRIAFGEEAVEHRGDGSCLWRCLARVLPNTDGWQHCQTGGRRGRPSCAGSGGLGCGRPEAQRQSPMRATLCSAHLRRTEGDCVHRPTLTARRSKRRRRGRRVARRQVSGCGPRRLNVKRRVTWWRGWHACVRRRQRSVSQGSD